MKFFTTQQLSENRAITPEGYLLVKNVSLARTGAQIYGPGETPVKGGHDGLVSIERDADDVFAEFTIASAQGKPFIDNHPTNQQFVTKDNWRDYARGFVMNVRRGSGADSDLLLGDLMVTDADTIELIEDGKVQISLGYDCEWEQIAPGRGRQTKILINHVALVRNGRCGQRCAIGDHTEENTMPGMKGIFARIRKAVADNKPDEVAKACDEGEAAEEKEEAKEVNKADASGNADKKANDEAFVSKEAFDKHVADNNGRFDKLETLIKGKAADEEKKDEPEEKKEEEKKDDAKAEDSNEETEEMKVEDSIAKEAPTGAKDAARKATDSAYLADSYQETAANAEIIMPGVSIPAFDAAVAKEKTFKDITDLRRKTLDLYYGTVEGRELIDEVLGSSQVFDSRTIDCDCLRNTFNAVAATKKRLNRATVADRGGSNVVSIGGGLGVIGKHKTLSAFQEQLNKHYNK